jgi:hypothetical protein
MEWLANTPLRTESRAVGFNPRTGFSRRHTDPVTHESEIGTAIVDHAVHLQQDLGAGVIETVYEMTLP